jgi:hypothetical protein
MGCISRFKIPSFVFEAVVGTVQKQEKADDEADLTRLS